MAISVCISLDIMKVYSPVYLFGDFQSENFMIILCDTVHKKLVSQVYDVTVACH